jgi:hypothetical protein
VKCLIKWICNVQLIFFTHFYTRVYLDETSSTGVFVGNVAIFLNCVPILILDVCFFFRFSFDKKTTVDVVIFCVVINQLNFVGITVYI